ncbi:hypothetical protein ROP_00930 [Rhodococcus opacus B4]|uniref:Transposase n=1 Tax=Rhodococcus opacus (strain B4) TaxID=632772 RepID=C1AS91_RHOOB|nr:hypothetical protein ROP_00930 [Rhodococcus opacus B4]
MVTGWCEQVTRAFRWRIEHDHRELKPVLGLDHYDEPSWLGGHHHAALVTAAHLFLATLRLTHPNSVRQNRPATPPAANVHAH